MKRRKSIYKLVLSGCPERADQVIRQYFPQADVEALSNETIHQLPFAGRVRYLRRTKGDALVIAQQQHPTDQIPLHILGVGLIVRCSTILIASADDVRVLTQLQLLRHLPRLLFSLFCDGVFLLASFVVLQVLKNVIRMPAHVRQDLPVNLELVHLYPVAHGSSAPGGEMSYLKGTLSGLAETGIAMSAISSVPVLIPSREVHVVSPDYKYCVLREARALRYNFRFFRRALPILRQQRPRALYQRHNAFVFSGTLLSRALGIPLILEYQCSELWMANNWDPCHFRGLLKTAEELTLSSAHGYVALSNVLRNELLARGIPYTRIAVNPAAVDPKCFYPGCGAAPEVRKRYGINGDEIVVCFLGSFSYYHGIPVLQKSIAQLLRKYAEPDQGPRLRFLLVGDGLLRQQMKEQLDLIPGSERVTFAGSVDHASVPGILDASDILVSPHVPLEDGSDFFGSPSKLFEYMAAGRAIIASNMFQLGEILEHGRTAWMVEPGDDAELADAIEALACDGEMRRLLGANARAVVLDRHTWKLNGMRVLQLARGCEGPTPSRAIYSGQVSQDSPS